MEMPTPPGPRYVGMAECQAADMDGMAGPDTPMECDAVEGIENGEEVTTGRRKKKEAEPTGTT